MKQELYLFCMLNNFKKTINPIIHYFGKKKMEKHFHKPPLLIGGCGRSGTTLLLSVLSAHPEVFAFPYELSAFNYWKKGKEGNLIPKRMDRLHRYVLFNKVPKSASFWCEKTPRNVNHLKNIFKYFNDEVFFIHIIRDGRDVMLSKHPDKPGEYWVQPERWVNDVKAGLEYKNHTRVLTIKYEELILNFKDTIQKICSFIDIALVDELLDWHSYASVRRNNAWQGKVQKLNSSSIEKWKRTDDTERIHQIMQNGEVVGLLKELGYEV